MASSRTYPSSITYNDYGSAGGRDYTDLGTWEAATDVDMVTTTTSYVLQCYADSASYDDNCICAGGTANGSYHRGVEAESGARHLGIPGNGVYFDSTTADEVFQFADNGASGFVFDLEVRQTSNSTSQFETVHLARQNTKAVGILAHDSLNSGSGVTRGIYGQAREFYIVNCIVHDCQYLAVRLGPTAVRGYCYNTVAWGSDFAYNNQSATVPMFVKNCIAGDAATTNFADSGGGWGDSTNNSSDTTTNAGSNPINSNTPTFVDEANDDLRLAAGDANCKDGGASLSADTYYPFDDDIAYNTRPYNSTWDVGAHEYTPAADEGIFPQIIIMT